MGSVVLFICSASSVLYLAGCDVRIRMRLLFVSMYVVPVGVMGECLFFLCCRCVLMLW